MARSNPVVVSVVAVAGAAEAPAAAAEALRHRRPRRVPSPLPKPAAKDQLPKSTVGFALTQRPTTGGPLSFWCALFYRPPWLS